jgi:hypothetical protein
MDVAVNREEIKKVLLEVLRENASKAKKGPRLFFIYNEGLESLDIALREATTISKAAGNTSFYQGPKAHSLMGKRDVKVLTKANSSLNTATNENMARVLDHADMLILPTLSLRVIERVANLRGDCQDSHIILTALLKGVKVLAASDGFIKPGVKLAKGLEGEVNLLLKSLIDKGVSLCSTKELSATYFSLIGEEKASPEIVEAKNMAQALSLITARVVTDAAGVGEKEVYVTKKGLITPLATDMAKEYSIKILRESK